MVLTTSMPRSKSLLDTRPKYYIIEIPRRVAFTDMDYSLNMDHEDDNPFRPGSELSREAEIIVNLIKEGKPITPTGDITSANNENPIQKQQQPEVGSSDNIGESFTKQNRQPLQQSTITLKKDDNNGKIPSQNNILSSKNIEPGQVEVQHGIIISSNDNMQTVEQVNLKRKRKCCLIQ